MAALGIAHHGHANALEKPVIAGFAAGDGLVVHIPRRFWHTGQERLRQYVYEREQRLLSYP
jgi:glycerol-3-phosphate cytidylyltransferase-like family protein